MYTVSKGFPGAEFGTETIGDAPPNLKSWPPWTPQVVYRSFATREEAEEMLSYPNRVGVTSFVFIRYI